MSIKNKAYIVGIYEHPTRKAEDKSLAQLHAESAKGAIEDAGLSKSDIDGYFCAGDAPGLGPLSMADYMGLKLRHMDSTDTGGSSYLIHVGHAAEAIALGKCNVALITLAGKPRSEGQATGTAARTVQNTPDAPFENPYGPATKMASELIGGMTSGLCDSMLGRGTIEFRPTGPVAIRSDGREQPMYRAEYRGGGSRVVVLPQGGTTFTHMIIDFNGPDHATVAAVGCGLRRVGGARSMETAMATETPSSDRAAREQWTLLGTSETDGHPEVFVSRSTLVRSGPLAKMVELWDFKAPRTIAGKTFMSLRNQFEYDCIASRKRLLFTTGYSKRMGQGVVVASGSPDAAGWSEVPTTGALHDTWKAACTKL